jgi:ABC-type lipoprotein export system ATPase subunit
VLLADEPTGNLDSTTGAEILKELRRLNREQGQTIILVTHDPSIAAAAERLVTVRDGHIASDVRAGELRPVDERPAPAPAFPVGALPAVAPH